MTGFLAGEVEYPGRSVHLEQVLGYVERTGKVRWEASDLREVCLFLRALPEELQSSRRHKLLKDLVRRGLKTFPEVAEFPFMAGHMEIDKGPRWCNRTLARRYFERARDLARTAGPGGAKLVEIAEHELTFLAEMSGPPPMPGGYSAGRFDEDDEDDVFDPFEGASPGEVFADFANVCRTLGLDPKEVLDQIAAGGPFRFRPPGGRRARS
jgi:hypothetical protein